MASVLIESAVIVLVSIIPPSILVLPGPVCVFIAVIIPLMSMVLASMLIWSEII